jgi:O-antigen/teichoic acid export membrane protein
MNISSPSFQVAVLVRASTTFIGFFITLIMIREFTPEYFAHYQLTLVIGYFLAWCVDFGMTSLYTQFRSQNNYKMAISAWGIRLSHFAFATILAFSGYLISVFSLITVLLFLGALLDLMTDNQIAIRQLYCSQYRFQFTTIGKKAVQVIFLILSIEMGIFNLSTVAYILFVPSALLMFHDHLNFGGLKVVNPSEIYSEGYKIWFQAGGSVLTQLESVVVFSRLDLHLLKVLAASRKISNALGIVGAAHVPLSLSVAATDKRQVKNQILLVSKTAMWIFLIAVIPLILVAKALFANLFDLKISNNEYIVIICVLMCIPLGVMSANLNAVLLGLRKYRQAGIATYSSTLIYLGSAWYLSHISSLFFAACLLANAIIEVLVSIYFLRGLLFNLERT